MLETIHSVTQSINSFIRPMGLSLCNQQQITARIALLALAVLNLPIAAKAFLGSNEDFSESNEAFSDCVQGCRQYNMTQSGYCIRDCMTRHLL
ncbi:hypothetical protein [Candidatus Rhabdochlamydia sp. T3358]|uniref:hypothetical protein n=1 Tax=Candidatus Rhabdochlamydia sp. T3358 TaxID=2099795 RepID=UPI0010AFD37A|nr:hypothetical protein [Candidatus Rhabdochlamydia sp. T3358]VHO00926.1 hypothetical protein RHT_00235 [Candidatus Rhabdochlamydia sp. T3358]